MGPIQEPNTSNSQQINSSKLKKFQCEQFDEKTIYLCQFCGGQSCSHEDYLKNTKEPNAIEGLHSNWITENILAMQRPSERLIKSYNIYSKFKELKINTILNLQEPGEHPFCGDGIIPMEGFSYIPEKFFKQGIRFFNEYWEDMTATTFEHMMKIMNIFSQSLQGDGKIAVHCHAGRGRTLLVICSWLIYNNRMSATQTINLAVQKRQGVLTRSSQRDFLHQFEAELTQRWKSFQITIKKPFTSYIEWQTVSLLNKQKNKIKMIPYLQKEILEILKERISIKTDDFKTTLQQLINPCHNVPWTETDRQILQELKNCINRNKYQNIRDMKSRVLTEAFFDFYDEFPYTILTSHSIDILIESAQILNKDIKQKELQLQFFWSNILIQPAIIHDLGVGSIATIVDLANFVKFFLQNFENQEDSNKIEAQKNLKNIQKQCLCYRLSLMLLTKKQYFPKLFRETRQCKIQKYLNKIEKYTNQKIVFLSKLISSLADEICSDSNSTEKFILQLKKVDANLYFHTKQHRISNQIFYSHHTTEIYDKSKIN